MAKPARRSPLKAKPLRHAGQPIQDEIDHWYDDVLTDHLVLLFAGVTVWTVAQFDGSNLVVAGTRPSRDPVVQARAQAAWVAKTLEELTGRRYPVRPVVVFPGWFVERAAQPTARDVWVLEPKELRGRLAREPHMIPPKDVALSHSRLELVARGGA